MVRLIRTGGTCQVWEAVRDEQRVAVKFLQPEVRTDKEEIGYLKHEFEVGQTLHHPNVIEIFEFNIDRSIAFLVMEFHPGRNIKMLLRLGIETFGHHGHYDHRQRGPGTAVPARAGVGASGHQTG